MTKRILTRQQKWRIEKIHQERIKRASKKAQQIEQSSEQCSEQQFSAEQTELSSEHTGLVIKNYGQSLDVEAIDDDRDSDADGYSKHKTYRCSFRQNVGALVAGDKVVWHKIKSLASSSEQQVQPYEGIISALTERKSLLARPDPYGKQKIIAANIDQILIINAPYSLLPGKNTLRTPRLNTGLIDRYLVTAERNQIQACIIINKIDLLSDKELSHIKEKLSGYKKLGYELGYTSATSETAVAEQLSDLLVNKNSILVGQSGVGKSSLLNALLPDAKAKTSSVSLANAKGRHTTSAAQLYHLDQLGINDATIIDSPGIREFGLWDINEADVTNGFKEIKGLSQNCRFRDCKHKNEPQCAILEAVEENILSESRYLSYLKIINSL